MSDMEQIHGAVRNLVVALHELIVDCGMDEFKDTISTDGGWKINVFVTVTERPPAEVEE